MNNSGIYKITGPKACIYIGSAVNIQRRWNEHKYKLNKNKHLSKYMQHHWNKYGENAFTFEILEYVNTVETLFEIEQKFLNWLFSEIPKNRIYNTCKFVGFVMLGRKHSDETKEKISIAKRGKRSSAETLKKLSAARIGRKRSDETRVKISIGKQGKLLSDEHKKKISNAMKKTLNIYVVDGQNNKYLVTTIIDFCRKYNIDDGAFNRLLKGKVKSCGGFRLQSNT